MYDFSSIKMDFKYTYFQVFSKKIITSIRVVILKKKKKSNVLKMIALHFLIIFEVLDYKVWISFVTLYKRCRGSWFPLSSQELNRDKSERSQLEGECELHYYTPYFSIYQWIFKWYYTYVDVRITLSIEPW